MPWGNALALLLRAGIAATRRGPKPLEITEAAERAFGSAGMALHETVARRRRGQILGGEEGRAMVEATDGWMSHQQIKNPNRMAAMLAPGAWSR